MSLTRIIVGMCLAVAVLVTGLVIFSLPRTPSNNRDWVEELAVQPEISIDSATRTVTFTNIRDWSYQGSGVSAKNYVDRTYAVDDLEQVWFLLEPFGKFPGIAHTYLTFDFKDQPPISFSIEARKERGEDFSAFKGLFNNYEIMYTWGTESDFLVRRVEYLENTVYMVPLTYNQEFWEHLFVNLAQDTVELQQQPRFYNTLSSNCTNALAREVNDFAPGTITFTPARYLTGLSGKFMVRKGFLQGVDDWDQQKEMYNVSPIVREFSGTSSAELAEFIRQELP